MRYLRPIPRRLLPDDMMVWPAAGDGSFGAAVLVRHVRFERTESAVDVFAGMSDADDLVRSLNDAEADLTLVGDANSDKE